MSSEKFRRNTVEVRAAPSKDEMGKLGEDDLSEGGETSLGVPRNVASTCVDNVRFNPKVIEFLDVFPGKQFSVKIRIQNVGRNPLWIKMGEPKSFIFQLKKPIRRPRFLTAGSSISRTVTCSYHNDDAVQRSHIPVLINGHLVEYPIVVSRAEPRISVSPEKLDFEVINLGASAKTLLLTICNGGGRRTRFDIDLGKNDLDLVVTPKRGIVKAKEEATVFVEMIGTVEGEYFKELWVTTNEAPIRIPVLVRVVRPMLEVVLPKGTEDFGLINLRPTFNGSQSATSFLLKNDSAETTLFVTMVEVNGELEFLKEARKRHPTLSMFQMTTEEGRLEPFEYRIMTVLFRPGGTPRKKGWHHEEKKAPREHVVFVRFNRVHCIEKKELAGQADLGRVPMTTRDKAVSLMESATPPLDTKTILTTDYVSQILESTSAERISRFLVDASSMEDKGLRLCLHGKSVEPDVAVQPTAFHLGTMEVGESKRRVLRVTNGSIIRVRLGFSKVMNADVQPKDGWLRPEESREFQVSVSPTCAGRFKLTLVIQVQAESDVLFSGDLAMETIASVPVPIRYCAVYRVRHVKHKAATGITDASTPWATFKDARDLPYSAVLLSQKRATMPGWMKAAAAAAAAAGDREKDVADALVALPNDRPRVYQTWPKENVCRTIFKGLFRYSPPVDVTYTLIAEELEEKKRHRALWNKFARSLAAESHANPDDLRRAFWEYKLSCRKHYDMSGYAPEPPETVGGCLRTRETHPTEALVPLTPILLSRVNVEPLFINFGKIAPSALMEETLTIENRNPFPISIQFIPGKPGVAILEGNTIVILAMAVKTIKISFRTKDMGRHNGFLYYVINGSHEFKVVISAEVTAKTLEVTVPQSKGLSWQVDENTLVVEYGDFAPASAFQPRSFFLYLENSLQSPIRFRWVFPEDCCYVPTLADGEVPMRTKFPSEFIVQPDPKSPSTVELKFFSECGGSQEIKITRKFHPAPVAFQVPRMDMGDVSLNLLTCARSVVENAAYHDVFFEVFNWNPLPGVTVEPSRGKIKSRSFFPLSITIQIPVPMKFVFDLCLLCHTGDRICAKMTGKVVVPLIVLRPSEIVMRRICAQSFDTVMLCAENQGTVPAELEIDFAECTEYRVMDEGGRMHLPPGGCKKFAIRFEPQDVARHVFFLPIIINNLLGPPMIQDSETELVSYYTSKLERTYRTQGDMLRNKNQLKKIPCICLNSTVTSSLLKISPLKVAFSTIDAFTCEFQSQAVVFSNEFVDSVTFCFRTDDLGEENGSPFSLVPLDEDAVEYRLRSVKASLQRGQELVFKASFRPKKPGPQSVQVPVFVRGYNHGVVYNYITMTGELRPSRIFSEATEIHFSPLPLGVGSEVTISVFASDYTARESISCVFWNPSQGFRSAADAVACTWLTEPVVTRSKNTQVLQLQVVFRSEVPTAVKGYILILDSQGRYCSVLVTGVADNSTVTTHCFLPARLHKYKVVKDTPMPMKWMAEDHEAIVPYPLTRSVFNFLKDKHHRSPRASSQAPPECQDKVPKLVLQTSKSTHLGFANLTKNTARPRDSNTSAMSPVKVKPFNSVTSTTESYVGQRAVPPAPSVAYPYFPGSDDTFGSHFLETLEYVERWIYEVVMRCDQYMVIPLSFQMTGSASPAQKNPKGRRQKDFLDFLEQLVDNDATFPERVSLKNVPSRERVARLHGFFAEVLQFLRGHGCLLPHVNPEHLLQYEDYEAYAASQKLVDTFEWRHLEAPINVKVKPEPAGEVLKNDSSSLVRISWRKHWDLESDPDLVRERPEEPKPEEPEAVAPSSELESICHLLEDKTFEHETDVLDRNAFQARSTQAWLDIILQVFRNFVLRKICYKSTIPQVTKYEVYEAMEPENAEPYDLSDTCQFQGFLSMAQEPQESNLYSFQERVLLAWVNHHLRVQRASLWKDAAAAERTVNNFDKDLADSVALISVTASHCPYIADAFFGDVFYEADTPTKMHHNAGKLVLAWREVGIGLTVETSDVVASNGVFMILLLSRLYEILPSLHPQSLICFSAPLTEEMTRYIPLRNNSGENIHLEGKFVGPGADQFRLSVASTFKLQPYRMKQIGVVFSAKKIKKVTATLILVGCVVSPYFGRNLAFYLEGEPSVLRETERFEFAVPLYETLCTEIAVTPPFPEAATYEIWYTTTMPEYIDGIDISAFVKPWSRICNRKIPRRLSLHQSEVVAGEGNAPTSLGITITCLTEERRLFWLFFCSPSVGDFIVLVETEPQPSPVENVIAAFHSEGWYPNAVCLCKKKGGKPRSTGSHPSRCPLLTQVNVPKRNDALWNALARSFFRALNPLEKTFWAEHFETSIGLCLILWLISPEEETEVVDEFVRLLPTRVTYTLAVEPPNARYVQVPETVEVQDVRERSHVSVPVHLSSDAPAELDLNLIMSSEHGREVRKFSVSIRRREAAPAPAGPPATNLQEIESSMCRPPHPKEARRPCKKRGSRRAPPP